MGRLKTQYKGVWSSIKSYFQAYGGLKDVLCSPYLHVSVLIALFCFEGWAGGDWEDIIIAAAPPFIAFSLGAAAIFNSIGDSSFREMLLKTKRKGVQVSTYVEISAQLVHFIVIQTLALVMAIVSKSSPTNWYSTHIDNHPCGAIFLSGFVVFYKFLAYTVFIYGCLLVFATIFLIFNISSSISRNFEIDQSEKNKK